MHKKEEEKDHEFGHSHIDDLQGSYRSHMNTSILYIEMKRRITKRKRRNIK